MATRNEKIHGLIHTASTAAAGVGAGMAQVPGSDTPVICALQTAMIVSIAKLHGHSITESAAVDLLLTFTAAMGGRLVSQILIGWIPGLGNVTNAATAASITEAVGWAADAYFEKQAA